MPAPRSADPLGPLLLTSDPDLRDELLRLSAGAGARLDLPPPEEVHALDPLWLSRAWSAAPAVLVGADRAAAVAATAPGRRTGVQVVGWGSDDGAVLRAALALGAEQVVELPHGEVHLVELLTDLADRPDTGSRTPAPVLGVVGGSGGAGATVLASALGQVAAAGGPCLLVDGDPLGPGLDRVLGMEDVGGVRWDALAAGGGRLGARSLREAVPTREGLGVLAWGRSRGEGAAATGGAAVPEVDAVREAVSAARRGHDLVIVDLPRAALTTPSAAELVRRCDRVLVVCTGAVPALLSTVRVCRALDPAPGGSGAVRVVVRGRGLDPADVARVAGVPTVGAVPHQRGVAEAVDLGFGPLRSMRSPLARAARRLLGASLDGVAATSLGRVA